MNDDKINQIIEYLPHIPPNSKIYIGCDSQVHSYKRKKGQFTCYSAAVIIHKSQKNGCKVFADSWVEKGSSIEIFHRIMKEVEKTVEIYQILEEALLEHEVEIHLDINSDTRYPSSKVAASAVGYVHSITGRPTFIKPNSFAASNVSDRYAR